MGRQASVFPISDFRVPAVCDRLLVPRRFEISVSHAGTCSRCMRLRVFIGQTMEPHEKLLINSNINEFNKNFQLRYWLESTACARRSCQFLCIYYFMSSITDERIVYARQVRWMEDKNIGYYKAGVHMMKSRLSTENSRWSKFKLHHFLIVRSMHHRSSPRGSTKHQHYHLSLCTP